MEQPLEAILVPFSPERKQAILDGTLKACIFERHVNHTIGKVILCDHLQPWVVMAYIKEVRHTTLREITKKEYRAAGFTESLEELLCSWQNKNITITADSPVTFIQWDNVSGALVEKAERIKALRGKKAKVTCDHCETPAIWVRKTQFSGEHFFCDGCAKKEKDFGKEDPSYFYWTKLE